MPQKLLCSHYSCRFHLVCCTVLIFCIFVLADGGEAGKVHDHESCPASGECLGRYKDPPPSIHILQPQDKSFITKSESGVWIALQVLGIDLEKSGAFVRFSVDNGALSHDSQELSGRVGIGAGYHTLSAELHGPESLVQGDSTIAQVEFWVEDPEEIEEGVESVVDSDGGQEPDGRTGAFERGGERRGHCGYVMRTRTSSFEGSGTEEEVWVQLAAGGRRSKEVLLGGGDVGGLAFSEDGGEGCFILSAPCSLHPVSHVILTHRIRDAWSTEGLYMQDVWLSAPRSCAECADTQTDNGSRLTRNICDGCLRDDPSLPKATVCAMSGDDVGRTSGSDGAEGFSGWGDSGEGRLFHCGRWFDEAVGLSGGCPLARRDKARRDTTDKAVDGNGRGFTGGLVDEGVRWVTNSRLGVSGMMGNQLFQLAALLSLALDPDNPSQAIIPSL